MNKIVIALVVVAVATVGSAWYVVSHEPTPPLGAVASSEILQNVFSIGGVKYYEARVPFNATSSEPCIFKPTDIATSTLMSFSLIASSTTAFGTQTFDVSTTTNNVTSAGYGSSTPAFIYGATLATSNTSVGWLLNASTTPTTWGYSPAASGTGTGQSPLIIKPNEFVTVRYATSTPGTYSATAGVYPRGFCSAVFRQI